MRRKKVTALFLAAVMTAGILTGCGDAAGQPVKDNGAGTQAQDDAGAQDKQEADQKTDSGEKVNIKLFTGKIETIDVMNEIIDDFNKSQDRITVEQEYQKDASNIIKVKFASGEVPDIMTTYEQGFVDEGKYMDISDQSAWWDRMSPDMKAACTDVKTGKTYRVCTNMTMAGFFYNKEMFNELGIAEFPDQWDEFEAMLTKIKTEKPDVVPWFIFGSEAWHLGHLIEFIPHGYVKSELGTIEAKKAMLENRQEELKFADSDGPMAVFATRMKALQDKGLINEDVLTATNDNCVQDFVSGKTAMFSNGMWAISSVLEASPEMADKIGFAPYPAYMPGSSPVVLSAEDSGYAISATTEHKEECIEFMNFLFLPENQQKYCEVAKAPSAFQDVTANWAPEAVADEVAAALENAVNIGYTNEKPAGFSGDDAGRMLQGLFAGQYTPEQFAQAYADAWNDGI